MKLGASLPNVTFRTRVRDESIGGDNPFRWQDQTTEDLFAGKRALLIGLPGAFTPTCSTRQLPAFDEMAEEFAAAGIDTIYCISVNDAFVMYQWGKSLGLKSIRMIPDGCGDFTRQFGMMVRKDNLGFGLRSWRYAAVVENGKVQGWFEEPGLRDNANEDPYEVSTPENVMSWLQNRTESQAA